MVNLVLLSHFNFSGGVVGGAPNNAVMNEKSSLMAFQHLVSLSIEGLELWRLVCEHQFHSVIHMASDVSSKPVVCLYSELSLSRISKR